MAGRTPLAVTPCWRPSCRACWSASAGLCPLFFARLTSRSAFCLVRLQRAHVAAPGSCLSLDSQVGGADHCRPLSLSPPPSLAAGTHRPLSRLSLSRAPSSDAQGSNRIPIFLPGLFFRPGSRATMATFTGAPALFFGEAAARAGRGADIALPDDRSSNLRRAQECGTQTCPTFPSEGLVCKRCGTGRLHSPHQRGWRQRCVRKACWENCITSS
jgi:hypothetical protein